LRHPRSPASTWRWSGTILGLLGPNGAGKTTLVSIVAGLRRADSGSVHVGGVDVGRHPKPAQRLIGFAPQETGVYPVLTVRDNLRFFAGLAGLRRRDARVRIDEVGAALGLDALFTRRASELSGGERRRLHTAIALLHRPRLVLLDEPTTAPSARATRSCSSYARSPTRLGGRVLDATTDRKRSMRRSRSSITVDRRAASCLSSCVTGCAMN
jgi:ABC-2 type transport system ATP-binding protein